jgi:RimJ/RimL family protein N-acetyltransferase
LCVGAGGTATWERCGLGLPALAWPIADNQKKLLHDAAALGLVYVPDFDCPSIDDIALHLQALMENALLRRHIAARCLQAVDCQGASRVVSKLMNIDITLRKATMDDMQMVYNWRNHINIRKCSRNNEEIDIQQHQRWFREVLDDQDRLLLIGSLDTRDIAVLRYDIDDNQAEVSVFLAPDEMGRGYGKALLAAGEKYILANRPDVKSVIADVMAENKVSQKLFESSGYALNAMQYIKRFYK